MDHNFGQGGRPWASPRRIAQVELGMKMPSVMLVKLAAELFGCTTDSLIFGDEARDSA